MDKSRGIRKGCAPAASRHRAASPAGLKAFGFSLSGIGWRGALSKLRDFLFETPTDALGRINFWCSMIALAGVGGIVALWIVTEIV